MAAAPSRQARGEAADREQQGRTQPGGRDRDCDRGRWRARPGAEQRDPEPAEHAAAADRPPPRHVRPPPLGQAEGDDQRQDGQQAKHGQPVSHWLDLIGAMEGTHMARVDRLKVEHGMGHGHATALVGHLLAG